MAALQVAFSFLFYKFGGLYFYSGESDAFVPVSELLSQGGGENVFISIGLVLFSVLIIFNLFRLKYKWSLKDTSFLFLVLVLQGFCLLLIEVGSFEVTIFEVNSWILIGWLFIYLSFITALMFNLILWFLSSFNAKY